MQFVIAILLAAGASTRMGSVKALQPVEDEPAVRHLIRQLRQVCDTCVVVTGYHRQPIEATVLGLDGVIVARNPHPEQGQLSSLKCGLHAAAIVRANWYLFTPVDWMGIDQEVLRPMLGALRSASESELLCVPEFRGRRGHPVALRHELAKEFLRLPEGATARDIIHRYRAQTCFVQIPNDRFLIDVNTPEDFQRFLASRSNATMEVNERDPEDFHE